MGNKKEVLNQDVKVDKSKVNALRMEMLKKFGTNAVIMGTDHEKATYGRISTGSIDLDLKLGGGIPVGRMIQISGERSCGKSTVCDFIIRNAQNQTIDWIWTERKMDKGREIVNEHKKSISGLICGYLDVEGTKEVSWTRDKIGVDTDSWLYAQPSGLEEALEMAHQMQKEGVNLIVLDSIDSLEPTLAYETSFGESTQMGIKPKMIGEYCRKFTATNNKLVREGNLPCTVILINQVREKIGNIYGDPTFTPGGKAIDFYVSVDIRLRRGDWIVEGKGDNKRIVGQIIKFKTHKNKTYKQQQTGEFDFYFDNIEGHKMGEIDNFKEIIIAGIEYGIIERAGSWMRYKGENLAQGADNTVTFLRNNLDKFNQIKDELFRIVNLDIK